jgi:hypothetical protein
MKKSLTLLVGFGLAVSLQAGVITCDYPVVACEPVFKTVIKKTPSKECWEEQLVSTPTQSSSNCCVASALVVSKRCTVTKCKTVWNSVEEQVLVGYKNYAEVCGKKISKFSKCKLKTIRVTGSY